MNTITLYTRHRTPFEFVLNGRITELTIHTPLSQKMVMDELLSGGYAVGGTAEGILLRPLAMDAGYVVGGEAEGYVTYYLALQDGYSVGGSANPVLVDYADGFSDGYSVGGGMSTILTRYRYVSEADSLAIAAMDTMMLSDIEFITLE